MLDRTMFRRRRQCSVCPWKKSTNPKAIPNGYTREGHERLRTTCSPSSDSLRMMACHDAPEVAPYACVGWVKNQAGTHPLLLLAERIFHILDPRLFKTEGPQHETLDAMCDGAKR